MADLDAYTRSQRLRQRVGTLWKDRSSWDDTWRDIAQYQAPRHGRFLVDEYNEGKRKDQRILDNTALFAQRTLAAGMMAGMTSPARPWFRLQLRDEDIMEYKPVKQWLHDARQTILKVFASSNTYRVLHGMYSELGLFGTAAAFRLPDFNSVIRLYPMTIGEYALACNFRGEVDTIARKFKYSVGQMIDEFGRDAVSTAVRNLYDRGQYDQMVSVQHIVQPRRDRDTRYRDARNMRFESVYFEEGAENPDQLLRDSGFNTFPALTPRWEVTGNDVYGSGPGRECLGDVRQLQHEQLRKGQGLDYQVNPPLQVPTAYKEYAKARLPGGVFHVDTASPGAGVRSAFEVNLDLSGLLGDILDIRERINRAYYADLFLMLANDDRTGITATEVNERHEEKMLMLGPVLERLHNEMLGPLVEGTFAHCLEVGVIPPPPEEIQGEPFDIEFVSTLAQAQRAVESGALDQVLGRVGNLAGLKPEILDKLDEDQIVDDLAERYGTNPKVIRSADEVDAIRAQRAQQQQAMQAQAEAAGAAQLAKETSEIDPQNMREVMGMFQGYGAQQ